MAERNKDTDKTIQSLWREEAGVDLTLDEAGEIKDNLSAFFKLLAKWDTDCDGDENGI